MISERAHVGRVHVDVGAYVLGILDEADHERFEAHLVDCHQCQVELQALAGLPDVLDSIRAAEQAPPAGISDRVLIGALDEVAAVRQRRRRNTWLAVAAAAVLLVAAPTVALRVGMTTQTSASQAPPNLTSPSAPPARQFTGNNPGGAVATVGVFPKSWGSAVELELAGVNGPLRCSLVAVSRAGEESVVGSWSVPDAGYGERNPLRMTGGAAVSPNDIARFEIRTNTGQRLLEVKA